MEGLLIVGGVIVLVAIFWLVYKAAEKARLEKIARLTAFAARHNLMYAGEIPLYEGGWLSRTPTPFMAEFGQMSPFPGNENPRLSDLVIGQAYGYGWHLGTFSYQVTTSNGKTTSTTHYHFAICAVTLPCSMPELNIRAENFFDRIGAALGARDIEFEVEEFNRQYHVTGSDRKFAYDFLHPTAIEWLLARNKWPWSFCGNRLLISQSGVGDAGVYERMVEDVKDFLALMPDFVRQDLEGTSR